MKPLYIKNIQTSQKWTDDVLINVLLGFIEDYNLTDKLKMYFSDLSEESCDSRINENEDRCEHGKFYTGAGACSCCGG